MKWSSRALGPIGFAALLGAVVAFATTRERPPAEPPASPEPAARGTVGSAPPVTTAPAVAAPPAVASSVASATALREPSVTPSATAGAAPAGSGSPSVTPTPGVPPPLVLAPITNADEQLQAELECDRKKLPESCERAARALESGSAGARDVTRANKLRRVALTLYVKQCESDRALACTRLAEMHEQGDTIQKNPRNAAALRERVQKLCAQNPDQLACPAR